MPSRLRNDDLLPGDDSEVIATAVRSLKAGSTMLPRPKYRFVAVPESPWSSGIGLLSSCIALLDAPDNSVLCVSIADRGLNEIVVPPPGASTVVPNNPRPVSIDEGVCQILSDVLLPVCEVVRGDVMEVSPWSMIVSPLVVESCRMRMRGTPAFTAAVLEGLDQIETVATALVGIAVTLKVGVVVTLSSNAEDSPGMTLIGMMADAANREVDAIRSDDGVGYGCVLR